MKKIIFACLFSAFFLSLCSCGSSKSVARTPRAPERVYQLAAQEKDKLRAAQSATSYLEDVALENAENAAVTALASRLESAIIGVRERFNKNDQADALVGTDQTSKNYLKTFIAQKLSYKLVETPSIYDNPDKTITAYVCVELTTPTKQILEDAYEKLKQDKFLGIEIEKDEFVKENEEELNKLKSKIGL